MVPSLVPRAGLEPATLSLEVSCSIQLSYRGMVRDTGVEPVSQVWKTCILTDIRIPLANRGDYSRPDQAKRTIKRERGKIMNKNFLVVTTTTNDIPGYKVTDVYGEVFGLIVRSRNLFSNIGAGFRTIFGGEVRGYTKLLASTREQAIERMCEEARAKGANAVIAMNFDSGGMGNIMNEVAAYGTAVKIEKA